MSTRQENENELKALMALGEHIDVAIKNTKIRRGILILAGENCIRKQELLKEELRAR